MLGRPGAALGMLLMIFVGNPLWAAASAPVLTVWVLAGLAPVLLGGLRRQPANVAMSSDPSDEVAARA